MVSFGVIAGSAAVAMGAAVLLANSPWLTPQPPPYDLKKIGEARLEKLPQNTASRSSGASVVKAESLWQERGAVVLVVRRAG